MAEGPGANAAADKAALRTQLRARRRQPRPTASADGEAAARHLLPLLAGLQTIALHLPAGGELDAVTPLLRLLPGRRWCFPAVDGDSMALFEASTLPSLPGAFGIAEPPRDRPVLLGELDALLIPGLGFTRDGHRLGRGGGFYDKLLAHVGFPTLRIGLCYGWQILPTLPVVGHDVAMTHLATELGLFVCQTRPPSA